MALTLTVNGELKELTELAPGASLQDVLQGLGLKADRVAVERNGDIVPRAAWGSVRLEELDRLEVVHFVGGGCM